ncbi:putative transcriptional regulator [Acidianus rod-shaped virus 1]|uniref:Putative transcriptional regulator n=1 Tax=Acidianus rod-shaped virus 1 TaxID=309181 RepID=Q50I60_9VIRU|nr:putative transcriptional regulator [Acidianus rod-shaped virus 1]CAI44166.1 putative transcriptional regulator [Acidianus rod-shaped virus 1]
METQKRAQNKLGLLDQKVSVRLDTDTYEKIVKIAKEKNKRISQITRSIIQEGLRDE